MTRRFAQAVHAPNPSVHPGSTSPRSRAVNPEERIGAVFLLLLIWQMFELGRPPTPAGVPLLISGVLFFDWIFRNDKQWTGQAIWWFVLLAVAALGIVAAPNTYSAGLATRFMLSTFLGVCLPLQALLNSPLRLRWWVYGFLFVSLYANGWAATHGGWGPAGAGGAQDENYMAALGGMALPFAYFSLFIEKRMVPRILLGILILACIATVVLGQNVSRGGFLGLCAVGLYCLARSPRKWTGVAIVGLVVVVVALLAGPKFWAEIRTTTDVNSGTGDVRLEIWKTGLRMWQANPIFGVGAGNFRWVIGDYQSAEQFEKFGRGLGGSIVAHSLHVELLAELGLAGVLATAALVFTAWRGLGKVRDAIPAKEADPDLAMIRCYADATRGSIIAILVNGIFLSLLLFSHLWLLIAVGTAIPFVYRRVAGGATRRAPAETSPRWRPGVVLRPPPGTQTNTRTS